MRLKTAVTAHIANVSSLPYEGSFVTDSVNLFLRITDDKRFILSENTMDGTVEVDT